jgi:hypothetical protein
MSGQRPAIEAVGVAWLTACASAHRERPLSPRCSVGSSRIYRLAMRPAVVGRGECPAPARQGDGRAFDVIDARPPLLLASDTIFRRASTSRPGFNDPFIRLFQDGAFG